MHGKETQRAQGCGILHRSEVPVAKGAGNEQPWGQPASRHSIRGHFLHLHSLHHLNREGACPSAAAQPLGSFQTMRLWHGEQGVRKPPGSSKTGPGPGQLGRVLSWGQAQASGKVPSTVGLWLFSVESSHFPSEYGKPNAAQREAGCGSRHPSEGCIPSVTWPVARSRLLRAPETGVENCGVWSSLVPT